MIRSTLRDEIVNKPVVDIHAFTVWSNSESFGEKYFQLSVVFAAFWLCWCVWNGVSWGDDLHDCVNGKAGDGVGSWLKS
ncbi:hypothetical protein CFELI_01615 [Corynebacterium felinum]|uniref:Uncharacterized protein n=1 Tax=Corynebacterium felinum TaxID=131318 RepID=A0ABU2B7L4_9CORY|nr:hypothetical protein [Corynebacterium felinum]MDR7354601.1 hypothetical protein [Corynebacterium felinum]WJY93966.1 hypothetical protein CFELI_01615 [Corynebacterium felinum]